MYNKAGARHSATDQRAIQEAHDAICKAGATCGTTKAIGAPWSAVKATGGGKIEGLLIRFTSPMELDAAGDYFDHKTYTDLEDGDALPTLWHHGLDPEIGKRQIGKGVVKLTPAGWWFTTWLNRRDAYEAYMLKMAELGKLGYSSGADPASVVRQPIPGKAYGKRIARWEVIEGSLTPIPADMRNLVSIKSLMAGQPDRKAQLLARMRALELAAIEDEERKVRLLRRMAELERS